MHLVERCEATIATATHALGFLNTPEHMGSPGRGMQQITVEDLYYDALGFIGKCLPS